MAIERGLRSRDMARKLAAAAPRPRIPRPRPLKNPRPRYAPLDEPDRPKAACYTYEYKSN
jgi:hypothetical protein